MIPLHRKRLILAFLIVPLLYPLLVAAVEISLGVLQPKWWRDPVVITTTDDKGQPHQRVLSGLFLGDVLYIGVNHWPRSWYRQAMARPKVSIDIPGKGIRRFVAVQISGQEYERVNNRFRIPPRWRFLTGYPPRHILRMDPLAEDG